MLISARLALGAAASSGGPRSGHWRPHRSLGQSAPCESTGRSLASMRLPRSRQKRARVVAALRPSPAGSGPEATGPMAEPGDRGTAAVDEFRRRTGPFGYRSVRCRNRSGRCADSNGSRLQLRHRASCALPPKARLGVLVVWKCRNLGCERPARPKNLIRDVLARRLPSNVRLRRQAASTTFGRESSTRLHPHAEEKPDHRGCGPGL